MRDITTLLWEYEPIAPKLNDNRFELWDLDEEVADIINYIFKNHNIAPISWDNEEVLDIATFKKILLYLKRQIEKNR